MARSNKQSLDIRFKSLSAPWKTRCKPLLYLCHNDYALWVCDIERAAECVVIQYCTSALPAVHRDHCLAGLWAETAASDVTAQTKVCLQSADSSRRPALPVFLSVFCACQCLVFSAHRWVGKLGAYSALCSSSVDESSSHRNPFPTLSPPAFYLPPSHFHYCFYLILQPHLFPTDHHPSSHFKQLLVFVEA